MRNYKVLVGNMTNKKDHGHAAALLPKPPTTKINLVLLPHCDYVLLMLVLLHYEPNKSDMRIPIFQLIWFHFGAILNWQFLICLRQKSSYILIV